MRSNLPGLITVFAVFEKMQLGKCDADKVNILRGRKDIPCIFVPSFFASQHQVISIVEHQRKPFFIAALALLAIISARLFWPYNIHIEDAITLAPDMQYGIHISIWRVLFEPLLGLLLFFNRALYALRELPVLLYWMLAAFVLYAIWRAMEYTTVRDRKRFILRQLAHIPILLSLWFTLFAIIIFIPLPNNTIENYSVGSVLVNTHAHSTYSHDGLISQDALWRWHKRNGYDAFFITDHNNHGRTLDFVIAQRSGEIAPDPLVMCGEEFSGSNHLSLLGLKREFSTRGYSDTTVIDSVRANGGAVIVNHWFDDKNMSLAYYRDLGVDGFEIENSASDKVYDRALYAQIKDFCVRHGLLMVGGVDFHGYGNACTLWNAFEIPGWKDLDQKGRGEAILDILKSRNQAKVTVLKYSDRPFYSDDALWISPVRTVVYYFRTLHWHQIASWAFWLFALAVLVRQLTQARHANRWLSVNRLLPLAGVAGSVFLVALGLVYLAKHRPVEGFTEIYAEYSSLLLYAGTGFLLYSVLVVYFRVARSRTSHKP
jgi:hypothetical protein